MLRIITGTERSDKTYALSLLVRQSVQDGKKVCIIIPDQFSLVYDRKLYDMLGAKAFNKVTVIGPDRLAGKLINSFGASGSYCDDNTRLIMIYKACREFDRSGQARYFRRSLDKGSFFRNISETIDELRQSGCEPEALIAASETLGGTAADKLYDVGSIFYLYRRQLEAHNIRDRSSAIREAAEIITANKVFSGWDVYLDSFSSFSPDQFRMLEAIFRQADSICAALTIGSGINSHSPLSPFAVSVRTRTELERLASDCGHRVVSVKAEDKSSGAIRFLADNVFANPSRPFQPEETGEGAEEQEEREDGKAVKIVYASDENAQAEFVFAEITRLVREKKCSCGEIAVISRDLEGASGLLEEMAYRYELPLFCDLRVNVSLSAPVIFINSVLDCVASGTFRTKAVLSCIKSPLSYVTLSEADLLEDYVMKWSVDGDMWLSSFTAFDESLAEINSVREKVIAPLVKLKSSASDTTAHGISEALLSFMREVRMNSSLFSGFQSMEDGDRQSVELVRQYKQLWQLFLSVIMSVSDTLRDERMTLKEYSELLRAMLSQLTVSSPPQRLDAVIAASAEHSRLSGIKAAFVIGVNDGAFPKTVRLNGLFTEREKLALEKADIHMEKRLDPCVSEERFVCYQALTCASDAVYICVPSAGSKGDMLHPSPLAEQISRMFKDSISVDAASLPTEFYCPAKRAALYKYAELVRTSPEKAAAVEKALSCFDGYKRRIDFAKASALPPDHKLSAATAKKMFLQNGLRLSATKTDAFFRCPFSYFCKYGLKIQSSKKIELKAASRGSITHRCLESLMSDENGGYKKDFVSLSEASVRKAVSDCTEEYVREVMGGGFGKDGSFSAGIELLREQVVNTVQNVQRELAGSQFIPQAFEYSLDDGDGKPLFRLTADDGTEIILTVFIDRVDIFRSDRQPDKESESADSTGYVRIVDYKTGKTDFSYADVYNGVGQQLLIYLLAVTSTMNCLNRDMRLKAAGIMYMKAGDVEGRMLADRRELKEGLSDDKRQKIKASAFSRSGVILNDLELADKMNRNKEFLPVKVNKPSKKEPLGAFSANSKKYALSEQTLEKLLQYAKDSLLLMESELASGNIRAFPLRKESFDPCEYCDYKASCQRYGGKYGKQISKEDEKKLLELIGAEISNGEENSDEC